METGPATSQGFTPPSPLKTPTCLLRSATRFCVDSRFRFSRLSDSLPRISRRSTIGHEQSARFQKSQLAFPRGHHCLGHQRFGQRFAAAANANIELPVPSEYRDRLFCNETLQKHAQRHVHLQLGHLTVGCKYAKGAGLSVRARSTEQERGRQAVSAPHTPPSCDYGNSQCHCAAQPAQRTENDTQARAALGESGRLDAHYVVAVLGGGQCHWLFFSELGQNQRESL